MHKHSIITFRSNCIDLNQNNDDALDSVLSTQYTIMMKVKTKISRVKDLAEPGSMAQKYDETKHYYDVTT